jgi:hypothetical protein
VGKSSRGFGIAAKEIAFARIILRLGGYVYSGELLSESRTKALVSAYIQRPETIEDPRYAKTEMRACRDSTGYGA